MTANTNDLGFIHRFEPAHTSDAPTLLLLHGTGGDETDLLDLGRSLHPTAALLSPRGKVLEQGNVPRFFRRLREGVFDEEDIRLRTDELATFVGAAAEHYGFDAHQVIAVGYSNGANIAASLLLLRPGVLHAAVLLHPMLPLEPAQRPDLHATRVLMTVGRNDPITPPASAQQLDAHLRAAGAAVELNWQPGGHNLSHAELYTAQAWLAERWPA